jgi:hypothetical protein
LLEVGMRLNPRSRKAALKLSAAFRSPHAATIVS